MATVNAVSTSQADVQTAIDTAVDGDTVEVPAGSSTWATRVTIPETKGIIFHGAGIGVTNITNPTTSTILAINLGTSNTTVDVSGFTFDANNIDTLGANFLQFLGGRIDGFRFHHCELINLLGSGLTVMQDGLETSGVIDNVRFHMPVATGGSKSIRITGTGPLEHQPFGFPFALGGPNFIFFEDCTFDFDGANDGALDAFAGARYVFRYNTVNNTDVSHHGADSGSMRGIHSFEIYKNTLVKPVGSALRMHYFRSGSGVIHNNTYTGNYQANSIELTIFRADESHAPWGQCDGTSIWDENAGPPSGYACLDQSGHIFTDTSGGSNTIVGIYEWNNTFDGANVDFRLDGHNSAAYFTEDVEYFNDTVRPGYTAFTYPHPLRLESGRQVPDTILSQTALTGAVTDIDDDPDSPDLNWLIADNNNVNTAVRVSFPTPADSPTVGASLQEFHVQVREFDAGQTGTPTARIELWENGLLVRAGSEISIDGTSQLLSFSWDASELGTANGSLIECNVVGTRAGGSPGVRNSIEVGAIEWNADLTVDSGTNINTGAVSLSMTELVLALQADISLTTATQSVDLTEQVGAITFEKVINALTTAVALAIPGTSVETDVTFIGSSVLISVSSQQASVSVGVPSTIVDAGTVIINASSQLAAINVQRAILSTLEALSIERFGASLNISKIISSQVASIGLFRHGPDINFGGVATNIHQTRTSTAALMMKSLRKKGRRK